VDVDERLQLLHAAIMRQLDREARGLAELNRLLTPPGVVDAEAARRRRAFRVLRGGV
jgi:hypothetical protein